MKRFTGKWPKGQVGILLNGYREFLDNCEHSVEEIRESYKDCPPLKVMYDLDRAVTYDLMYDNSHPAYSDGEWEVDGEVRPRPARKRMVSHNPDFVFYPEGCNDNHRVAVLKYIGKEIGLV